MKKFAFAAVAAFTVTTAAYAAVTFDPATGTGFVGKGDVQLVYGWNNKQLQENAGSVQFRANSLTVSEVSWTCSKENATEQVRERTTTTAIQGVVTTVARERNQVTGFNLMGYSGAPTQSVETDGPALNSCPSASSGFYLSSPAGDPIVIASSSVLQVSTNGSTWTDLGL